MNKNNPVFASIKPMGRSVIDHKSQILVKQPEGPGHTAPPADRKAEVQPRLQRGKIIILKRQESQHNQWLNASPPRITCRADVDSSLGKESMSTSTSLAVLAIRVANSCAYSARKDSHIYIYMSTRTKSQHNPKKTCTVRSEPCTGVFVWGVNNDKSELDAGNRRRGLKHTSPSVGFAGWSLFIAVWMLLKEAGGAHCCRTPMALQNWSAS